MLRKLRIIFTFTGIMLLLGTIVTNEWESAGERLSYAGIAILMIVICQPRAVFRLFRRIGKFVAQLINGAAHNVSTQSNREDSCSCEPDPPVNISSGNIAVLSDDDMHIFLQHYYKADEIRTKVRGVSYRNDDGTDRQCILAHCHAGDQLRFKRFEYEGSPAYAVYCDWGQIGNLSAELAEDIAAREKQCIMLGEILNVSGGYQGEYFGCNICLNIYEKY